MSAVVLDAGALIQLDKRNPRAWQELNRALDRDATVVVPVCALGQVWRGGSRQASLSRALRKCVSAPLDEDDAKACGVLLGAAGTADLVDASVVHVAAQQRSSGPVDVMTTDKNDVARLLGAIGVSIGTIEV